MSIPPLSPSLAPAPPPALSQADRLQAQCRKLESAFLSEMLSHAGVGSLSGSFGGGEGEEQFQSFLRAALADKIVERGGVGLAERLFEAMKGRIDDA